MSFLNPIALWGLLALMIPLIIHFLSKKQQNVIYFGSNKFLESKETTSARSIQLSDLLLLLLRTLLLASIVLAVSKFSFSESKKTKQLYIEHQIANNKAYTSIISEATLKNRVVQYFTYDKEESKDGVRYFPSSYTLINHLNHIHDSILVYSYSLADNFIGTAVGLNQDIEWVTVPHMEKTINDSSNNAPLTMNIKYAESSKNNLVEFKHVIKSIAQHLPFEIVYEKNSEWNVYIDTFNTEFRNNSNQINWQTSHPTFSFTKQIDGYRMEGSMSKKVFLESNFPIEFAQALINSRLTKEANKNKTHQPIYKEVLEEATLAKANASQAHKSYTQYFWLFAFLLLFIERIYSLRTEST